MIILWLNECYESTASFLFLGFFVLQLIGWHFDWNKSTYHLHYISSCLFYTEARAIFSNAASTPSLFLALVVKCFILGCFDKNSWMEESYTSRSSSRSILLPIRIKGNFSGSLGAPWFKNSVIHVSMLSKDWIGRWVRAYLWCHRRGRSSQRHDRRLLRDSWIFIVQLCPRSAWQKGNLEVDDLSVNDHFLLHEVRPHCGLVGLQEFLIDVAICVPRYALRSEVLPTLSGWWVTLSRQGWSPLRVSSCSLIKKINI